MKEKNRRIKNWFHGLSRPSVQSSESEGVGKTSHFNFQPFEIENPFNGKPHAYAKAFWNGKERGFAIALVDGWVRFCEVDKLDSGQWNFAVNQRIPTLSSHIKVNPAFVENAFKTALEKQEVGRLFRFEVDNSDEYDYDDWETGAQWVFMETGNRGIIEFKEERTYFETDTSLSFVNSSISEWHAEIERWICESNSEFSFLFRWNKADKKEKVWLLTHLANGTRAEMEGIARLILGLNNEFLAKAREENSERVFASIVLGNLETPAEMESIVYLNWYDDEVYLSKIPFELWNVFIRHFEPQIEPNLYENIPRPISEAHMFWSLMLRLAN